jgi:hypothetical protein
MNNKMHSIFVIVVGWVGSAVAGVDSPEREKRWVNTWDGACVTTTNTPSDSGVIHQKTSMSIISHNCT